MEFSISLSLQNFSYKAKSVILLFPLLFSYSMAFDTETFSAQFDVKFVFFNFLVPCPVDFRFC